MDKVATFKTTAAQLAKTELTTWNGRPASDTGVRARLEAYGSAAGHTDPPDFASDAANRRRHFGPGFISFVVTQAAADAGLASGAFRPSTLASVSLMWARFNRNKKTLANPFWLYRLDEVRPEVGDLLCRNFPGSSTPVTYDNLDTASGCQVDIVTSASASQLLTIGGDLGQDTVGQTSVARTDGYVTATSATAADGTYFAILRVRTSPTEGMLLP
jgi:hypothetical protein